MESGKGVLVVGGTGHLGSRVVRELLARGKRVRALVREGTDAQQLEEKGVEIVRGNMLDPPSLSRALDGVTAVATTAIGYSRRKKGDSLKSVDDIGNRNLVDAARLKHVGRFVFTSVLTCDKAPQVPHFWQKKLIEDYLETSGVPFVAVRPGAFVGGADFWARGLRKGTLTAIGSAKAKWTYIGIDDVARSIAKAVDAPGVEGKKIDLGWDRPVSTQEIAEIFSHLLSRSIRVRTLSMGLVHGAAGIMGLFVPFACDAVSMMDYFLTGQYVADTSLQKKLLGSVPTVEETLKRYVDEHFSPTA
ncbi:MAG: SDR family oxidoreductase [Spirochaetia bacterium]|jgi:uncharacterized protein YbjT (DUF2867 family)